MNSRSYLDLVPPSVKVHVEKYQQILEDYKHVKAFMDDCVSGGCNTEKKLKGIYVEAFCVGALSVLQSVREVICGIELYIENTSDSISWLHILNEFYHIPSVLASLKASIEMIKSEKYYGCKIFDLCDNFINCGLPSIKHVFIIIQKFCLKKLYMQIKFWLMEGVLHDPSDEFFIRSIKHCGMSQDTLNNTVGASIASNAHSISSARLMFPTMLPSFLNASCETFKTRTTNSITLNSHESSKYEINANNLPSLIPFSVAVKMLFIGEALIMCQRNRVNSNKNNLLEDCGISEENVLSQLNEIENCEQFDLKNFNTLINDLWLKINKRICELSEEVGNISSVLVSMSDIFLLGRGDLFQEFLLKASHYLSADIKTVSSRNLNVALRDAFYNVYKTDVSDIVDNFYFDLPNRRSLKSGIKTISMMSLEYNVKWPLHYLFTPDVIKTYNKLFRFLLNLKKAQMVLTSVCKSVNSIKEHTLRIEFTEVKMHLLSIVVNLQNYCFTNVVTHEMNALLSAIKAVEMFTDLQKYLSSFLCNVSNRLFISNSFQNNKTVVELEGINMRVFKCFKNILVLCDSFSELMNNEIDENVSLKLNSIKLDLYKVLKALFSLLKKIDQKYWFDDDDSAGNLYNLIMCLDYNRFYQKKFELNFDG